MSLAGRNILVKVVMLTRWPNLATVANQKVWERVELRVDEDRGGESAGEAEDEREEEPGLTRADLHSLAL